MTVTAQPAFGLEKKKKPGVKGEMDRFINGGGLCLVAAAIDWR